MKKTALLLVFFSLLLVGSLANADIMLTDGSLSLYMNSQGRFYDIILNETVIDDSLSPPATQFVNGDKFLYTVSNVSGSGAEATYTALVGDFSVAAITRILGPLASNPSTTNVLEQVFTFTNTSAGNRYLDSVSYIDQDLGPHPDYDDDIVSYDSLKKAVVARDSDSEVMMAAIADDSLATLGWHIGLPDEFIKPRDFESLKNIEDPSAEGDTAMAIGLDYGWVEPGESASLAFRYLFSNGLSEVPDDFSFTSVPEPSTLSFTSVPEPSTLLLMGSGLFCIPFLRRRSFFKTTPRP